MEQISAWRHALVQALRLTLRVCPHLKFYYFERCLVCGYVEQSWENPSFVASYENKSDFVVTSVALWQERTSETAGSVSSSVFVTWQTESGSVHQYSSVFCVHQLYGSRLLLCQQLQQGGETRLPRYASNQ